MQRKVCYLYLGLALALSACAAREDRRPETGLAGLKAVPGRPRAFPQRIWAACDFELGRSDVVWIGERVSTNIPAYPGNRMAAGAALAADGTKKFLAFKPVSYPRMGRANHIYFRYFLEGASSITIQLFNRERNFSHRARLRGLSEGEWSEATADLSGVPAGAGGPIRRGERMDGLVMEVEPAQGGADCELVVDDVIFFSDDSQGESPITGPFPGRVICLWAFDVLDYYHPWTHRNYRVLRKGEMLRNDWGVAQALPRENRPAKRIRLIIDPPQQVGAGTRLRFRYYLKGASSFQAQIFDLTDRDNRHIVLDNIEEGLWQWADLDFTAEGIKNDGKQTPFRAGNLVDDIFFFPLNGGEDAELLIDEVVLYDAGVD